MFFSWIWALLGMLGIGGAAYAYSRKESSGLEAGFDELGQEDPDPKTLEDAADEAEDSGLPETADVLEGYAVASRVVRRIKQLPPTRVQLREFLREYLNQGAGPDHIELVFIRERVPNMGQNLADYIHAMLKRGEGIRPEEIRDFAKSMFGLSGPSGGGGGGGGMAGSAVYGYEVAYNDPPFDDSEDGGSLEDELADLEDWLE